MSLAKAQASAQENNFENTRQQIIFGVKSRYLQVLQAEELLALAEKSLEHLGNIVG